MRKSEEMTEQLIAAVFKRTALWNPATLSRKNGRLVKEMWINVAKEIGTDVSKCRTKWKNLRAYFVQQHRLMTENTGYGAAGVPVACTWTHYQSMMFLKDVIATEENRFYSTEENHSNDLSNLVAPKTENSNPQIPEEGENVSLDVDDCLSVVSSEPAIPPTPQVKPTPVSTTLESVPTVSFKVTQAATLKPEEKRTASKKPPTQNKHAQRYKQRKVDRNVSLNKGEENDDMLFFRSLLPYMRPFSQPQKLRLRNDIQSLLINALEANSDPISTPSQSYEWEPPGNHWMTTSRPSSANSLSNGSGCSPEVGDADEHFTPQLVKEETTKDVNSSQFSSD